MTDYFKIKVATTIKQDKGYTIVRYHNTDVVSFNDNTIILNSDGWHTNTTKNRFNEVSTVFGLGYSVYQRKGNWFIDYKGKTIPFVDGIKLIR